MYYENQSRGNLRLVWGLFKAFSSSQLDHILPSSWVPKLFVKLKQTKKVVLTSNVTLHSIVCLGIKTALWRRHVSLLIQQVSSPYGFTYRKTSWSLSFLTQKFCQLNSSNRSFISGMWKGSKEPNWIWFGSSAVLKISVACNFFWMKRKKEARFWPGAWADDLVSFYN